MTKRSDSKPMSGELRLDVRGQRLAYNVFAFCVAAELLFVIFDYHINYGRLTDIGAIRRLFNIAREDSLASWFGTTQTLFIGLTLWLIWLAVRQQTDSRWRRSGWLVLAVFFSYMSVDDGAMLHERAGTVFSKLTDHDSEAGEPASWISAVADLFPSYGWQVAVLPFFAVLGLFLVVFLWRELDSARARWLVAGAMTCFVLAVVLDFFEGLDEDHPLNLYQWIIARVDFGDFTEYRFRQSPFDTLDHFSKSIEEFLEMLGNSLLWLVFLEHLTRTASRLRVRFV